VKLIVDRYYKANLGLALRNSEYKFLKFRKNKLNLIETLLVFSYKGWKVGLVINPLLNLLLY
jgi:hypothetical protein